MRVGVKSTALRFGDSTKQWISGFGAACIGGLALSGYNANLGMLFYASLVAFICPHLHSSSSTFFNLFSWLVQNGHIMYS